MRAGRWMRGIVCGLFFLCFALARRAALELETRDMRGICTIALDWELTGRDGADMLEREQRQERPPAFALWGQQEGVAVENRDLSRTAACAQITVWGRSQLLLKSSAPLAEGDWDGCLLDQETAMALFGDPAPIGGSVSISGRQMTVRGIAETDWPLAVVLARAQDGGLDRLTLRAPEGDNLRLAATDFGARNGLAGVWSQPGGWAALSKVLSLLPAVVLLLGVIARYIRAAFSPEGGRVRFWVCILLAGGLWFMLLWMTGFRFQLPEEMVPNKWSDFDFWGRLFAEKREEWMGWLSKEKAIPEMELITLLLRALGFGLAAAVLTPFLSRPATLPRLWLTCAAGGGMAFAASLGLNPSLAHDRALWLALPLAFAGRWLLDKICGRENPVQGI